MWNSILPTLQIRPCLVTFQEHSVYKQNFCVLAAKWHLLKIIAGYSKGVNTLTKYYLLIMSWKDPHLD